VFFGQGERQPVELLVTDGKCSKLSIKARGLFYKIFSYLKQNELELANFACPPPICIAFLFFH